MCPHGITAVFEEENSSIVMGHVSFFTIANSKACFARKMDVDGSEFECVVRFLFTTGFAFGVGAFWGVTGATMVKDTFLFKRIPLKMLALARIQNTSIG
jgi:hypothetical protein